MSVKVKCPKCDRFMLVESEEIGAKVKCVLCSKPFTARPDWMADGAPAEEKKPKKGEKKDLLAQEKKEKTKKAKQKAKEDEHLEPDVRWKPTAKDTPGRFVTCPECGKELPATAHICNQCGWNLVLARSAMAKGRSPVATVVRFAILACVLVAVGMGIGLAVRHFRATWQIQPDPKAQDETSKPAAASTSPSPKPSPQTKKQEPDTPPSATKPKPTRPATKPVRKPKKPVANRKPKRPDPKKQPAPADPLASLAESVVIVKTRTTTGLGFIIDPATATVATNRHILEAGREITIVAFPHGSRQWREFGRATIAAIHRKADVALVTFNPRGAKLESAVLAGEHGLKKGDKVVTIIRPSTSEVKRVEGAVGNASQNISGMSAVITSASVDAKTSGAPLFDSAGSVVGVNTYSDVWNPKAFAVDIAHVRELLNDPKSNSLPRDEMDALLKKGIDPLRDASSKGLLGRTLLDSATTKMLVDKAGIAVYAMQPDANSIAILSQNKVAATIFAGTNPTDFDITPDGKSLYVCVNEPTGISIIDVQKRARQELVRIDAERAFGVRALAGDRALVICGVIYRPTMPFASDREPLAGVKVLVVNMRTRKVEQELKSEVPLPIVKSITDRMPRKWTKKNMNTRREWQDREAFALRLFAFPVIARSHDGKAFYVAGYDQRNSTLKAKDLFAVFRYRTRRTTHPEATSPDRLSLYVPTTVKERTTNRRKTTRSKGPVLPEFAQFPQAMLVSPDGKTVLIGNAVLEGTKLQLMGTLKRNDAAYAKNPVLCNIHAAPNDFKIAFTGANAFDLQTFTDIATLPIVGTAMAVDREGKKLHVFNPSDNNVYSFAVKALLKR